LRIRLRTLTGNEPDIADRIAVHPVTGIGYDLYTAAFGQPNIAPPALIETLLRQAAAAVEGPSRQPPSRLPQDEEFLNGIDKVPHAEERSKSASRSRFSARFLIGEWCQVVDAWQLASWE